MTILRHCLLGLMVMATAVTVMDDSNAVAEMACEILSSQTAASETGGTYSAYSLKIDDQRYMAFPRESAEALFKKISQQRSEIKELQQILAAEKKQTAVLKEDLEARRLLDQAGTALIRELTEIKNGYKNISNDYQSLNLRYRQLTTNYEDLTNEYKEISKGYRDLVRGPTFTADVGLGIIGPDNDPAVLLGAGFRRIKVWGFFQEDNSGALLGISLPIF